MVNKQLTKVQLHEQVVAMEQDINFMRRLLEERDAHMKATVWARDKAQQEVKELKDKNKKLRTAITYMLHQLTNDSNEPKIKIALAIEEAIPVYAMLKDG